MQITYETYRRETGAGTRRSRSRADQRRRGPSGKEARRLRQLGVSLALFLAAFLGRGQFPAQWTAVGSYLQANTDFSALFQDLGQAISEEDSASAVAAWCVSVFASEQESTVHPLHPERWAEREIETVERVSPSRQFQALNQGEEPTTRRGFDVTHRDRPESSVPEAEEETAVEDASSLGVGETVTPVMGVVSSGFGYREHPLTGEEKFHNGVDLAVGKGTEILAFADGVVDFIGQSDAYGNYIQLRHDNGVTTFYAHCSELLLSTGTEVKAGDVIALSGDTGDVTGPHLHFEMKVDGVRVDPADYIETSAG